MSLGGPLEVRSSRVAEDRPLQIRPRLRAIPGLDGLRAVAVVAVMAYHAGVSWVNGGLLGVDVFFVISGFLVTALLLQERSATGTIALGRFWIRRGRRLLPALFVLLAGIAVYARWQSSGLPPVQVRGDALATLFYVANWHFILTGQNYFVRFGAPSPLLHTWSLAVEEQFYLVWPVIIWWAGKHCGRRGLGLLTGALAALSAALCAALYLHGSSVDRLYFGTDTRAQSLMVGALLAICLPVRSTGDAETTRSAGAALLLSAAGVAGAISLVYLLHVANGSGAFLYEGGFLVVALAAAAVIALVAYRPAHPLSRVLAVPPLRYLGRISYGLYLYHWPIFLVMDHARTGLEGAGLLAARFAVTVAVAVISFHAVEDPIRTRRNWVKDLLGWLKLGWMRSVAGLRVGGVLCAAGVFVALVTVTGDPSGLAAAANAGPIPTPVGTAPGGPAASAPVAPAASAPSSPAGGPTPPERALLLGDSMALTLGEGLSVDSSRWGVTVDNQGVVGCDLDPQSTVNIMGTVSRAAQGCPDWRTTWAKMVQEEDPDAVMVFLGRWETIDRYYDGRWVSVGDAAFDQHLQAELGQIVQIASARGAPVVFLTLPYIAQTTEQPNGNPWDMNLPSRTDAYNADVRAVVARYPGRAYVIDLNKMLDPDGHYVSYIDGVRVRNADDEHLSVAGGEWLRGRLLPQLVGIIAGHRS